MEGGVAIILLLIVAAVIGAVALYITGGALLGARADNDRPSGDEPRPDHKVVENPEKVELAGTERKE